MQKRIPILCLTRSDQLFGTGNIHGAIAINKLGITANTISITENRELDRRMLRCYESLMQVREKSPMIAAHWCQQAMDYYQADGDVAKVDELARKREKFSGGWSFKEFINGSGSNDLYCVVRVSREGAIRFSDGRNLGKDCGRSQTFYHLRTTWSCVPRCSRGCTALGRRHRKGDGR